MVRVLSHVKKHRACFWFGAVCVSASRGAFCGVGFCKRYLFLAVRFVLSWGVFFPGAVVRSCVCCSGRFAQAQAVELFAVWVFASGICSLRCGLFCSRVGFPQGQLYAAGFVLLVVLCGIGSLRCVLFCRRVGFPQWQLSASVFVVLGGLRKCKP